MPSQSGPDPTEWPLTGQPVSPARRLGDSFVRSFGGSVGTSLAWWGYGLLIVGVAALLVSLVPPVADHEATGTVVVGLSIPLLAVGLIWPVQIPLRAGIGGCSVGAVLWAAHDTVPSLRLVATALSGGVVLWVIGNVLHAYSRDFWRSQLAEDTIGRVMGRRDPTSLRGRLPSH